MDLPTILQSLPERRAALQKIREILVANTIIITEIPSPTFEERERLECARERFLENPSLESVTTDEEGNVRAVLPGRNPGSESILVSAHADTTPHEGMDHTVMVTSEAISAPGIADNSFGLAVVLSLPEILDALGIRFDHNLILLGEAKSLGEGDLRGLRFFLDSVKRPILAGICVEGVHLGRLSYSGQGMNRGEIICHLAAEPMDWHQGGHSAIAILNKIVSKILAIPIPSEPKSSIILGSVRSGRGFSRPPTVARLKFEVRSEQVGMARAIRERIEEIVDEVSAETGTNNTLNVLARRVPGGISFSHPLVKATREIMKGLSIQPRFAPSVGSLSALISKEIPGITLGITRATRLQEQDESIMIDDMYTGLAQLIGVLQYIDSHPGSMTFDSTPGPIGPQLDNLA